MNARIPVRFEPDAAHPAMRVVWVGDCAHRVSLADGQPGMNFVEFARHEHFIFCLNGLFLPEPQQAVIKHELGLREVAA